MADLSHFWGQDLVASPSGDLLLVQPLSAQNISTLNGNDEGTQRIYRRLMTAIAGAGQLSGEDIFAPDYGGGIPQRIGAVMDPDGLRAAIRAQMFQEAAVANSPPPQIKVTPQLPSSAFVDIQFSNAQTGLPVSLSFDSSS